MIVFFLISLKTHQTNCYPPIPFLSIPSHSLLFLSFDFSVKACSFHFFLFLFCFSLLDRASLLVHLLPFQLLLHYWYQISTFSILQNFISVFGLHLIDLIFSCKLFVCLQKFTTFKKERSVFYFCQGEKGPFDLRFYTVILCGRCD